jgi:hypothetical protein
MFNKLQTLFKQYAILLWIPIYIGFAYASRVLYRVKERPDGEYCMPGTDKNEVRYMQFIMVVILLIEIVGMAMMVRQYLRRQRIRDSIVRVTEGMGSPVRLNRAIAAREFTILLVGGGLMLMNLVGLSILTRRLQEANLEAGEICLPFKRRTELNFVRFSTALSWGLIILMTFKSLQ